MTRIRELSFENDVIDRLARIEERVMAVIDHEERIRAVEKKQWFLSGVAALLGAVAPQFIPGWHH